MPFASRAPFSLLAALMLVRFADEWFGFFPAGTLESIRADLGLSYTQTGIILASLGSGGLIGNGFSVAADYVDRRKLASAGALVVGLCLIAFAVGQSFLVLVAAGLVWGAASDAFVSGCEVTLVQLYPDKIAPALARVNVYGAIGDLLGPLTLAAAAAIGVGWRGVFAASGGLMIAYAVALAFQRFPAQQPAAVSTTPLEGVVAVFRNPSIIRLALIDGLFGLLDEPFQGFTIAYFERVRGVSETISMLIIAAWVVAGIVGYLSVSRITARWAPRAILLPLGITITVAVAILAAVPVVPIQALAAIIFGFAGAVFYSALVASLLSDQPDQAGTIHAVVSMIGLAGVAFPTLVGAVADHYGLTVALEVYAIVGPLMLLLLLAERPQAGRGARAPSLR